MVGNSRLARVDQLNEFMQTTPDHFINPKTPGTISLSNTQRALHDCFVAKSTDLANMYVGALMARSAMDNPESLVHACHSIRELIEKLPYHLNLVVQRDRTMGDEVRNLDRKWRNEPRVKNNNHDPLTEDFINVLDKFFNWYENNFTTNRQHARNYLPKMRIVTTLPLPNAIEDKHINEWLEMRDFFVRAAHHGACTGDDFDAWMTRFETFVLNQIKPETFKIADKLDELIAIGESDG